MRQKGSYTVEAALLMGILLSVLLAVLYLGFWYHDKNFLQNAAYEAACTASLRKEDETYRIQEAAVNLISGRMLGTSSLITESSNTKKTAQVLYRGKFRLPGMILAFFQDQNLDMKEGCEISVQRPSERIQKVRQIVKTGQHMFERNGR